VLISSKEYPPEVLVVTYPLGADSIAPQKILPEKSKMTTSRYRILLTKNFIKSKSSF